MHVGLNLLFLLPGIVGGTETYAAALLQHLARLDPANRYTLFVNVESGGRAWVEQPNFRTIVCGVRATSRARRYAYEQMVLPRLARREGIDVMHSLGYVAPLRLHCPSVVSIHDLNYEAIPEAFTPVRREVLRFLVPRGARRAGAVLTLSEASKRQIVDRLRVPANRVVVTYCAAEHVPTAAAGDGGDALSRLGIASPYILALSSGSPHKNLARLIRAFAQLDAAGVQLVLAGHEPTRGESVRGLAEELGIADSVIFTGYLSAGDLDEVRRGALLFAFPSLYEGFGIPVLEAMTAGVPVVSSNAASLPEVVGEAGRLVDPSSVDSIADGLRDVLTQPDLRARLVAAGRRQADRFSWTEAARRTLRVYEEVCSASNGDGRRAADPAGVAM